MIIKHMIFVLFAKISRFLFSNKLVDEKKKKKEAHRQLHKGEKKKRD
jgi:hypothetical protein